MSDICTLLYEMSENVSVSFCHGWLESLHRSFTWTQRLLFWNAKKSKTQGITTYMQHRFVLYMHAHKVWSALLATKQQATDISWFLYLHTHLQKNTIRGIKQLAEEKTPNATKHNPADLRKSGQDHGPMSGSWPQQPAEGDRCCTRLQQALSHQWPTIHELKPPVPGPQAIILWCPWQSRSDLLLEYKLSCLNSTNFCA